MPSVDPDAALLSVSDDDMFSALREVRRGEVLDRSQGVGHLLSRAGLTDDEGDATLVGEAIHKTRWVLGDQPTAKTLLGKSLRPLLPVQVIEQELRGFPPVSEEGILELLQIHGAASLDWTAEELRPALRVLNDLGVLVYSRKTKMVRVGRLPDEGEAAPGEDDRIAVLVSPQTPYSNVVRLRRILRRLTGTVYWVDKHFNARALEDLVEELEPENIGEVRILSGSAENVLTERSLKDFRRFEREMANRGVVVEWRAAPKDIANDLHDRWLVDSKSRYNLPPVNSFYKGQYSEIIQTDSEPPIKAWWAASTKRE